MDKDSKNDGNVNSTPETAVTWIDQKIRSHELSSNSGKLWIVAVNALGGMRRDDEKGTSEQMLELLPELERRWCIANDDSKGDTGKTYASRARSALRAHVRFLENPSGFRFDSKPRAVSSNPAKKKEKSQPPAAPAPAPTPPTDAHPSMPTSSIRIPLGNGRFIKTEFPDDITGAEAMRHFWVLVGYAADFDPSNRNDFLTAIVKAS